MALPALVSGADCGPLNPLQSLSKQFDKDRSVQQVGFSNAYAVATMLRVYVIGPFWTRTCRSFSRSALQLLNIPVLSDQHVQSPRLFAASLPTCLQ